MRRLTVFISFAFVVVCLIPSAFAEFRSAKDMQRECRVALEVVQGKAEKTFQNSLFTGECIGYIQGAGDAARVLAENASWYKVCVPDSVSTLVLIEKFIVFVDKYPKYVVASTAFLMMLSDEYPCAKK